MDERSIDWTHRIDAEAMIQLDMCSKVLHTDRPQPIAEEAEIDRLIKEVESLIAEIRDSSLPGELRVLLMDQLVEVHRALQMYWVDGLRPLKGAIERVVGTARLQDHDSARVDEKSPLGRRLVNLLKDLVVVVSFATATLKLGGDLNLLGLPAQPIVNELEAVCGTASVASAGDEVIDAEIPTSVQRGDSADGVGR